MTVHNSGITEFKGKTLMLFRSHLRNGLSVIGKAVSTNGLDNWEIDPEPFLKPCTKNDLHSSKYSIAELIENESGGVEDPRITKIGDSYYITYSAYHATIKNKVRVSLAVTKDFKSVKRLGPVIDMDMRNVVLFSEKIGGKYVALFRPNDDTSDDTGGIFSEIKIGYSLDIESNNWDLEKTPIMKQLGGPSAFGDKIGPGAPPIKTKHGWLNIFHGVRKTMDGNPYVLGVSLHDLDNPKNIKVANIPLLFPSKADCRVKEDDYVHVPNVVFSCGAIRKDDGSIYIYYGGNDTVMNVAVTHEDILTNMCELYPQDSMSGKALYKI
ncbi:MAG: glycosidase [Bacteroidetes bacterium 4572_77]|nr:MAG: glycosidase [Bacteroidetes bacterium 4572_77]